MVALFSVSSLMSCICLPFRMEVLHRHKYLPFIERELNEGVRTEEICCISTNYSVNGTCLWL